MHITEIENLPYLTTEQLEQAAARMAAEAAVEQERAYKAAIFAVLSGGEIVYGPEKPHHIVAIKQRMADGRREKAAIYHLAAQVRYETGV